MSLAKPKLADRRSAILDAAERCFAQSGFHQASMHDICVAAGMSPGNLYRYFASKEAIIAGIAVLANQRKKKRADLEPGRAPVVAILQDQRTR